MEEADTADRGPGDQFNGVDNLPEHPCALPDSKLCQALAGRQDFTARIPGIASTRSNSQRNRSAPMHFICELTQSLLNRAEA